MGEGHSRRRARSRAGPRRFIGSPRFTARTTQCHEHAHAQLLIQSGDEDRLIVCRRFSAWSNTMLADDSKDVARHLETRRHAGVLHHLAPTIVFGSWNAGKQCMN